MLPTEFVAGHRLPLALFRLLTCFLLALHLYVRTLPPTTTPIPADTSAEAAWWGLWPATYPPSWSVIVATLLLLCLTLGWWLLEQFPALLPTRYTQGPFERVIRGDPLDVPQKLAPLLSGSLLLLIAFFAFPIVHTRWGDAYLISKALAWPDPALRLTNSWQAPLDVWLHSQLWLHWHDYFQWEDALPVYRLLSPLAGGLYLAAAVAVTRVLAPAPAWLTFGLLASLGVIQLFFGYVENYSFVAAAILIYLWLGLATLQRRAPLWLAATALALANALHPSTVILAPTLLYCGWVVVGPKSTAQLRWWQATSAIFVPMLLIGGATVGMMEAGGHGLRALFTSDRPGGGDAHLFVPLWQITTRWEHYTMFSWLHLRDFLNEQLLVAPIILPGLLLGLLTIIATRGSPLGAPPATSDSPPANSQQPTANSHSLHFLTLATAAYLLFTWVWNPDYGGQRDWDLFSLAAIPTALLFALWIPRLFLHDRRALQAALIPLLVLQCLHTAAWIYQNTLPWAWPK
ncbi:MAG: hypothetical protein R3C14_13540 [Caldilineaceae bacterium]